MRRRRCTALNATSISLRIVTKQYGNLLFACNQHQRRFDPDDLLPGVSRRRREVDVVGIQVARKQDATEAKSRSTADERRTRSCGDEIG
jgi:hypothetical protein